MMELGSRMKPEKESEADSHMMLNHHVVIITGGDGDDD
jgi:hypothetical protein